MAKWKDALVGCRLFFLTLLLSTRGQICRADARYRANCYAFVLMLRLSQDSNDHLLEVQGLLADGMPVDAMHHAVIVSDITDMPLRWILKEINKHNERHVYTDESEDDMGLRAHWRIRRSWENRRENLKMGRESLFMNKFSGLTYNGPISVDDFVTEDDDTPLHAAVLANKMKAIKLLLAEGADVHALNFEDASPLSYAKELEMDAVIELFRGVDSNLAERGYNELSMRIRTGSMQPFLLKADLGHYLASDLDRNGYSLLHIAAMNDDIPAANFLLKRMDINTTHPVTRETPLLTAIRHNKTRVASFLLTIFSDINAPDAWGRSPLHLALEMGLQDFALDLLGYRPNLVKSENDGTIPLHHSIRKGFHNLSRIFIANTPQMMLWRDTVAPIRALDYDSFLSPHDIAREKADAEELTAFLTRCGIVDDPENLNKITADHFEEHNAPDVNNAENGFKNNNELLRWVRSGVNAGFNINLRTRGGDTLMHNAARNSNNELLAELLQRGADPDLPDAVEGKRPLHFAVQALNTEGVRILVESGARTLAIPEAGSGQNPAHRAVSFLGEDEKVIEMLQALISGRESAECFHELEITGKTVLHFAIARGASIQVVEFLLSNGAHVMTRDFRGLTVQESAEERADDTILDLLATFAP